MCASANGDVKQVSDSPGAGARGGDELTDSDSVPRGATSALNSQVTCLATGIKIKGNFTSFILAISSNYKFIAIRL